MSMATSTFHEFLQPSDASLGSATPCNGSSSPDVFFDAANQQSTTRLPVTSILGLGSKSDTYYDDAPKIPAASISVYIEDYKATQGLGGHHHGGAEIGALNGAHSDTSDTCNEDLKRQSCDFFHIQNRCEDGGDETPLQELNDKGTSCYTTDRPANGEDNASYPVPSPENQDDQKPKARRFLMDFLPQKQMGSNLREDTRKIVQMLANDKTCKIDRPSLGLQDRLQSLVQRSAGKRTSYVKGPRVCSTLVKIIVKRTQESLYYRRNSSHVYGNKQDDKPPLPVFNKPIQSYIKPPKHSKASGGDDVPSGGNQVNNANPFELIKRRKRDTDNALKEKTDSSSHPPVSTSPDPSAEGSQVISNTYDHLTDTATPQVTATNTPVATSTTTPHITDHHTPRNHLDTHKEERTPDNTHNGGETIHVSRTIELTQDTHDGLRSLVDVELKISVPYISQDQGTPESSNHRPSFLYNMIKNGDDDDNDDDDDDDDDDYVDDDDYYDDSPDAEETEITSRKYLSTVSRDAERDETKRPKVEEAATIPQDIQYKQDATLMNLTNGHTEQTSLSSENENDIYPLHPSNAPPRQQGDGMTNGPTDLRKHIASLNKVSLKFGVKNREQKSNDKNAAVTNDLSASPEQHSAPRTTRPTTSDANQVATGAGKENGERTINSSSSNSTPRFCMATAVENLSLPLYRGGEAMLRRLSYSDTSQGLQRSISTRDLLYTDEDKQTSALHQSALHVDTLMRLKTDNLVARHGGKKTHIQPYPTSPRQTTPTPSAATSAPTPVQEDAPNSVPEKEPEPLEILPPIPPNTQKAKRVSISPPASQVEKRRSKANCHWTRSRNASLEGSKKPSFSQDTLRKCLMAAVDQCYNTEWEETCDSDVVKDGNMSQEELNKSLVKAVTRHDAKKVRVLLKLGADPNVKCGNTPAILRAAKEGALYVMQALLAAGADVDARTDLGNSPLHLAARGGYSEAVVQLVHSGAFVDAINRSGVTPLQMALAYGHLEVARSLLCLNADMFLQNKVGETAYEVANQLGYTGLSVTPQEMRRDSGVGTKVELPSTGIPVAVRMIQGIEIGCAGTVDDCLREGASPNTLLPLALHWPARASALHRAAHHGHDLIVRLLLAAGADIDAKDVVGNTPLHVAAQAGHNRVVKILLERGAPREAVSQSGMTPLHRAASKGKELTCNLLLRRGCNRRAEDSSGRTPADWARKRGFKHVSQKLMYRRKSSNTLLAEGNEKQCLEHLHRLHEAALKANSQYPEPMVCEE